MAQLLPAEPHTMGPTWRRYDDGSWYLPEHSLGWDLISWYAANLKQPGTESDPFILTLEQMRFIVWWYAVDESGRFVYRDGLLRRMKGWGKDPLVSAMSLGELCGPVAFSHWDSEGNPVGKRKPNAWIQVAAVSQDQTKNTFSLFPSMVTPGLKEKFGLELNKTIIYSSDGGRIEGVTSSPHSMEGNRPTFVVKNEIQWWLDTNDGDTMDEVIQGNVDKAKDGGCRALAICNAHVPGQDSVAERAHDAYLDVLAGKAVDTRVLYDALEAPADTPLSQIPSEDTDPEGFEAGVAQLRAGLEIARGDAVWLDLDHIIPSMLDRRRPVTESRRKFLNQINAHEDSWISPAEWDVLQEDLTLEPGEKITLGLDGSKSDDHTALVACRVEDGAIFLIRTWDPAKYPTGEIPREEVDAVVRSQFERYEVVGFRSDVKELEAYVDQWSRDFKKVLKVKATPNNPVAFDMRGQTKRFALDCERFLDAVLEHELHHDGNTILRQHILNARRHPTTFDAISIRKASKDSSKKIDAAVCAVLAYGSRQDYLMNKRNRTGRVAVYS